MFSIFKKKSKTKAQLGVAFHPRGLCIAVVDRSREGAPSLSHCSYHVINEADEYGAEIARSVHEQGLYGISGVCVMEPGSYSLLQIEAPEVNPDEMRSAVRWRINGLIDFDIEDATVEVFNVPQGLRGGGRKLIYVVAAKASLIRHRIDMLEQAGIDLGSIDITELAMRNIAALSNQHKGTVAQLHLSPRFGLIGVTEQSTLYLTRRIEIGTEDLKQDNAIDLEQPDGSPFEAIASVGYGEPGLDTLILEIQRSLDYYESQFGRGPAKTLSILPWDQSSNRLADYAAENLTVDVETLSLHKVLAGADNIPADHLSQCLPAIGAALRSG